MSNSVCVSSGPLSNHRARQKAAPPSGPLHPLHSSARRRRGDFPPCARHLLQKSNFCVWVPARCSHPAYGDPSPALRGSGALACRAPPCQNRQISAVRGAPCQNRQISAAREALCQIRQSPSKRRPPSGPYYPPLQHRRWRGCLGRCSTSNRLAAGVTEGTKLWTPDLFASITFVLDIGTDV